MKTLEPSEKKQEKKKRLPYILAALFCLICFLIWRDLLVKKFYFFGYNDWDLAFFTQNMWNLMHGQYHSSLFNVHFFGNHANFFAYLLLPIFSLFSTPATLLALKLLSFVVSGYVLFIISEELIGWKAAVVIMLLYFLYPANSFALLYEFDFESLAPAFLMLSFYFFYKSRYALFLSSCLLLMLLKENMPLIVAGYGLVGLFKKPGQRIKWGIIPMLIGGIYFYLCTAVLIPFFGKQDSYGYMFLYPELGNNIAAVPVSILKKPITVFRLLTSSANAVYLHDLFKNLFYLPLFCPWPMFIVGGIFLQHLLSKGYQMHTIYYHYAMTLAPFIFISLVFVIKWLQQKISQLHVYFLIGCMFMLSISFLIKETPAFRIRMDLKNDYLFFYRKKFLGEINPKEGVVATFDYLTPLSTRSRLYAFYKVYAKEFQSKRDGFVVSNDVKKAVVDFNDPWLLREAFLRPRTISERLKKFFYSGNAWTIQGAAEDIVLLQRQAGPQLEQNNFGGLVKIEQMVSDDIEPVFILDENINLLVVNGLNDREITTNNIPLEFVWQTKKKTAIIYSFDIFLEGKGGVFFLRKRHIVGYFIHPVIFWEENTTIKERYYLTTADLPDGTYEVSVRFYVHDPKDQMNSNQRDARGLDMDFKEGKFYKEYQMGNTVISKKERF